MWVFRGLPACAGTFQVGDGGTNRAQPVSVTLTPERVAEIDLSYEGPATFAVQVVDGAGREVCALALGWAPLNSPSQGEGLIDEMSWPSLGSTGELERLCMQLPAGEYRFSASSYDLGAGSADVLLEANRFTLVRIPLTTPPSALRGPPR